MFLAPTQKGLLFSAPRVLQKALDMKIKFATAANLYDVFFFENQRHGLVLLDAS